MTVRTSERRLGRLRRQTSVRKRVQGSAERPRLCVFRSTKHVYAQVIDDVRGVTLASAHSYKLSAGSKTEGAKSVGTAVADACKKAGVSKVVFDRNGFRYHGRVKAMAESAREAGLEF